MSQHLRDQWRRLASRHGVEYLILPKDPERAHAALRRHAQGQGFDVTSAAGDAPWSRTLLHELTRPRPPGEDSGFTVHDYVGDAPKVGYMVSDPGAEEVHHLEHVVRNPDIIRNYYSQHQAAIAKPGKYFGAWVAPDTGKVFFDVSSHHHDIDKAHAMGRTNNQLSIYDIAARHSIPVEGGSRTSAFYEGPRSYGRNVTAFSDQVEAMVRDASSP